MGSFEDIQGHIQSPLPPNDNTDGTGCPNEMPAEEEDVVVTLEELKIAQAFIKAVQDATLDNSNLDSAVRDRLKNKIQEPLDLSEDPAILTSIELFLDMTLATTSQKVYENVCATFFRHMQRINPSVDFELLSHYRVQEKIAELTGVLHDARYVGCDTGHTAGDFWSYHTRHL